MHSMKRFETPFFSTRAVGLAAAVVSGVGCLGASAATVPLLADYPLFLAPPVTPNVLVLLDNSQSMDATMAGKVVSGDDPNTRGNTARRVLRQVISDNRGAFNWGLGTFELLGEPYLFNTLAYFLGSQTTMVYTDTCSVPLGSVADVTGYSPDGPRVVTSAAGVTPVTYKDNCLQNPDTLNGAPRNVKRYITFEVAGDDANINDVYYLAAPDAYAFGVGIAGGSGHLYNIYGQRDASTAWTVANFNPASCISCPVDFTPTDAGFLPDAASQQRMLFLRRGWGYGNSASGAGRIVEPVAAAAASTPAEIAAESAHYTTLMTALSPETNAASNEIKNGAYVTPLAGTLGTARKYFEGRLPNAKSPITQTCQRSYVVLATDGNPTGKADGTLYGTADWTNTRLGPDQWRYGIAQNEVFNEISRVDGSGQPVGGLRAAQVSGANLANSAVSGIKADIKTYVIGLGKTVINDSSLASLDEMAQLGAGAPKAFRADSVEAVQSAFQSVISSIQEQSGASASASVSSTVLNDSTVLYEPSFDSSHWTGDLKAFNVDATGTPLTTPLWSASAQLKAQDWDRGRAIVTYKPFGAPGTRGIPFRWPANAAAPTAQEFDAAQVALLNTSSTGAVDGEGLLRLQYLRGDSSHELARCGTCTPGWRSRTTPLGDMIDSAPLLVGAPNGAYYDDIASASYSAFVASQRQRKKVIYVGANDGMLHAFDAAQGRELMAYVPSPVYASLSQLMSPTYTHRYYANGSPMVGDAFYGGSWKSLLVSGMRAGGKGVFALDITRPENFSEANANSIVRWEFLNTQDPDVGFVYSQPVIVKTNDGRWSVIVANGYNATVGGAPGSSGHAVLFVLDAETGAVKKKIDTGAGTLASPNGLSGSALIDVNDDGAADVAYAGDLNGNLWKFDLSSSSPSSWAVGNGGAALFNTDEGHPEDGVRAITGRPNVAAFPGGGYIVVFGSGRYLSKADVTSTAAQTLYGIRDNLVPGTVTQDALVQQTVVATASGADGALYRLTTHAVGQPADAPSAGDAAVSVPAYYSGKRGWYLNLPTTGERAVTDSRLRGGRAIFSTSIPDVSNACAYGGNGWLMEIDAVTGNRDDRGTFDTNNNGVVDASDTIAFAAAKGNVASGRYFDGIPASPTTLGKPDKSADPNNPGKPRSACTEIRYVTRSDGRTEPVTVACGNANAGRAMWREVR